VYIVHSWMNLRKTPTVVAAGPITIIHSI